MKGSTDVENCRLVISYIPLSSISAVLLLHLRDTAEKSLLRTIEATGLKFHCWRGRLRRNKSGFNTTNISSYQMWAERIQKTREDRKTLGILQSFPFGMKVVFLFCFVFCFVLFFGFFVFCFCFCCCCCCFLGFQGRKPGQPAHLECISGPWTKGKTGWISPRCFPQSTLIKAHSNLSA